MTDYRADFKRRKFGFGNIDELRVLRADTVAEKRRTHRLEQFSKYRNLDPVPLLVKIPSPVKKTPKATDSRLERLMKWKKERELRKKLKKQQAKPIFKVGVIRHRYYSPVFLKPNTAEQNQEMKKPKPEIPKRITRATEKRLAAKAAEIAMNSQIANKKSGNKLKQTTEEKMKEKKCVKNMLAPEGYQFKPPAGLPQFSIIDVSPPVQLRKSGTTNWFVSDNDESKQNKEQKDDTCLANDSNGQRESMVRFGRPSVQKHKFKNFSIFEFNTPATEKKYCGNDNAKNNCENLPGDSPHKNAKNSSSSVSSKLNRRSIKPIGEFLDEEDENAMMTPKKNILSTQSKTPKVKTPMAKNIKFSSDTKSSSSPIRRKIKIRRAKLR